MKIETVNINTYGVYEIKTQGELNFIKRKEIDKFDFFDSDGEESFNTAEDIVFGSRDITVRCGLIGATNDLITKLDTFKAILETTGLLTLETGSGEAYEVYYLGGDDFKRISKRQTSVSLGTFTLKFREPDPDDSTIVGDALPTPEVTPPTGVPDGDSKFRIDDYDLFYNFGVNVISVRGIHSFAKRKQFPIPVDIWNSGEAYTPNTTAIHFAGRDVILSCTLRADTIAQFLMNFRLFKNLIYTAGLRSLKLPYEGTGYEIYLMNEGKVEMMTKWSGVPLVAKFDLKFRQP